MTYQSLYRKYRPKHLDEVVGQEHILNVLTNSLKKDMISHAYLFCGPRGTGKTSIAKLMAQAINCEKAGEVACKSCSNCLEGIAGTHPDIVEIDAASNNGVEEIRSLIEKVKYTPILGKYKVYIIDEVHMLSQGAFNAFLKTLEEPPEHAVFILATTEIHKVLPTIISRCQRFDFTNIKESDIANRLDYILGIEGVKAEKGVTQLIASLSSGALRNALTILEQAIIIADGEIKLEEIYDTNGVVTAEQKVALFESLNEDSMNTLKEHVNRLNSNVISVERLMMDLVRGLKDSVVFDYTKDETMVSYFDLPFIKYLSSNLSSDRRMDMVTTLLDFIDKMKFSQNQSVYMELALMKLYNGEHNVSRETFMEPNQVSTVSLVENKIEKIDQQPIEEVSVKPIRIPDVEVSANIDFEDVPRETFEESFEPAVALTHLELVQFMVSADKEERFKDIESFKGASRYRTDLSWARPSRLLDGANLVLSGEQFVVLAFNSEFEALELMEQKNKAASLDFSKVLFGSRKHMFATTNSDFTDAVQYFRTLSEEGNLPEAFTAEDFEEDVASVNEEARDKRLEKVVDLFGDSVTIIKE